MSTGDPLIDATVNDVVSTAQHRDELRNWLDGLPGDGRQALSLDPDRLRDALTEHLRAHPEQRADLAALVGRPSDPDNSTEDREEGLVSGEAAVSTSASDRILPSGMSSAPHGPASSVPGLGSGS
ncbi:hypothetical protein [Micromonospora cathayae]|uniref:Uncharacterized protein n=1 Tax=Micromonospora cathayae TaxID=3028804 RepID=A0ABY7ZJS2_9ACTN|nr:hypothetical protein [Micromonospora sp. HUAS 3]WDZ83239.1 hypothetical protein PVK37_22640 [Micromonospora sp. HUAS 3]